ncbi:MAG TPA: hypothetical protein VLF90_03285 [Patescibacteria group bacterium]|nr:hypothetical protein [Patescibacteria group bacterium]
MLEIQPCGVGERRRICPALSVLDIQINLYESAAENGNALAKKIARDFIEQREEFLARVDSGECIGIVREERRLGEHAPYFSAPACGLQFIDSQTRNVDNELTTLLSTEE